LTRNEDSLALLAHDIGANALGPDAVHARLDQLLKNGHELRRVLLLDAQGRVAASSDDTLAEPNAAPPELPAPSAAAGERARKSGKAHYSEPFATPASPGRMDFHLPLFNGAHYSGSLVASYDLDGLLAEMVPWWFAQDNEITLIDRDDKVVARHAAGGQGHGVYTHKHAFELPGATLVLATDSVKSAPRLLPNLLVGSVIVLAFGLLASLAALWRHVARRLAAEGALRQQMAFRTAMENSLVTGLRARDLEGRVTYVNPAFCQMVGLPPEQLLGKLPPMPYWAPEAMFEYQQRFAGVLAGTITPQFETVFQRSDGARIPVLIFEAPLVDSEGNQTGWMGSILDISDRKRAEELNRQQQEKLHASARLATMGEISSTLAHELNQPLAAISSYATGALNVIERAARNGTAIDGDMLKPVLEQASAQAQRAGQIIRSVHEFVKKREPLRQELALATLVEGIRALIELQARKFFVSLQIGISPDLPSVSADRMMVEQVLLNLTRNGIEAMQDSAPERRILRIDAAVEHGQVTVEVADHGQGIASAVAERLFSPFFSTKAEGMGMGLSICRSAIEFHGGTLGHRPNPGGGTVFTFTLPIHEVAHDARP
jgi:two-component system, LuxR family, sensor histidine kinase DctS